MTSLFTKEHTKPSLTKLQGVQWDVAKRGTIHKYIRKSFTKAFQVPGDLVTDLSKSIDPIFKQIYFEGIGSTTDLDWAGERIHQNALFEMRDQINRSKSIPLSFDHQGPRIGDVVGATVQGNRLLFRAKLDESSPITQNILSAMQSGKTFGYSIGGFKSVRTDTPNLIRSVDLTEIALCDVPCNPKAKHLATVDRD